jgi:hypothetical protein
VPTYVAAKTFKKSLKGPKKKPSKRPKNNQVKKTSTSSMALLILPVPKIVTLILSSIYQTMTHIHNTLFSINTYRLTSNQHSSSDTPSSIS